MFRNFVPKRLFNTLKSKNDEQNNQALLERLKGIKLAGDRVFKPPEVKKELKNDELRKLTLPKITRIIKQHFGDPLVWNENVLARVFRLPETVVCDLVNHVQPLIYFTDNKMEKAEKLTEYTVVIDVVKLKEDKNYMLRLSKFKFTNDPTDKVDRLK